MSSEHDAIKETSGLYVLGALEPAERAAFEAHLANCAACAAEVQTLRAVASALPYAVSQVEPPAGLRDRVLQSAASRQGPRALDAPALRPPPQRAAQPASRPVSIPASIPLGPAGRSRAAMGIGGWLAMAALLALSAGLGLYAASMRARVDTLEAQLQDAANRLDRTEQQLTAATARAAGVETRLAVLTAPDLRRVDLAGQPVAPGAAGRGFWSGTRGLVFAANALPPLPAGRTYQLWYLTTAAPISAGLFQPGADGSVAAAFDPPPAGRQPIGLAVSLEPAGGVPAPTGAIYLAGNTQ